MMKENGFELPKEKDEEVMSNEKEVVKDEPQNSQPKIEIAKEYYEKIDKETAEEANRTAMMNADKELIREQSNSTKKMLSLALISGILNFIVMYLISKTKYIVVLVPLYIIIGGVVYAKRDGKKSDFPSSYILGNILLAVITFLLSNLEQFDTDTFTYYAIFSGAVAILGYFISSIITKMIGDKENFKGIQTLGTIILIAGIFGGLYYLKNEKPEIIEKYIFNERNVIIASNENEYVTKIMQKRYGIEFVCGEEVSSGIRTDDGTDLRKVTNQIDQNKNLQTKRYCIDPNQKVITVISTQYQVSEQKYVIIDNYIDETKLQTVKENITKEITNKYLGNEIVIYLLPEKNCFFIGDCIDDDNLYKNYEKETSIADQYETSINLDMQKTITLSPKDFINNNKYKYQINVYGSFSNPVGMEMEFEEMATDILDILNKNGYKNTYGYQINIYDSNKTVELQKIVYSISGEKNSQEKFVIK